MRTMRSVSLLVVTLLVWLVVDVGRCLRLAGVLLREGQAC